jgi:hypothetical protein
VRTAEHGAAQQQVEQQPTGEQAAANESFSTNKVDRIAEFLG